MILLDQARLNRIRSLSATPHYNRCLASGQVGVTQGGEPENWWYRLVHAALMSVVTNDQAMGIAAAERLHSILDDDARMLSWENYDQHYLYRSLANLALVYDWTKQYLTPAQDARCREVLLHMAWRPWSIESFWGEDTIDSNYFGGYLLTGCLVAIATGDADLLAEMTAHCSNVLEWFETPEGMGGCYFEAFNYCGYAVMRTVLALKAMGYDLGAIQWFQDSATARIHTATPWGSNVLFGDNPQSSTGEFRAGDLLWVLCLIDNLPDPWRGELAFFLDQFRDKLQIQTGEDEGLHYALLWEDPSAVPIDYRQSHMLVWGGGAVQLWTRRSSWEPDAAYWFGAAGLVVYSHQMLAAGMLGFGKEGWISVGAALYSHGGGLGLQNGESMYCNVPLVAGESQEKRYLEGTPSNRVEIISANRLQMQGRDSYNRTAPVCVEFSRAVEWVSDTVFVVIDRVVPVEAGAITEWNWHGLEWSDIPDGQFSLTSGDYSEWGAAVQILDATGIIVDVTEDRSSDLGDAARKISEALRVQTDRPMVAFAFEITKTPEISTLHATINADDRVAISNRLIAQPLPVTLPPIVTGDGRGGSTPPPTNGGPPPVTLTPRTNSTTAATRADAPDGFHAATISGLPSGVTIIAAAASKVSNPGWVYQHGYPPGSGADQLVIDGMKVTWPADPADPNAEYVIKIAGSDNLEDIGLPIGTVAPEPPPPPIDVQALLDRIATLESENTVLQTALTRVEGERNALDARLSTLKATVRAACDAADLP